MPMTAVLAAGVGVRHGSGWSLRSASFRLESPPAGQPSLGIVILEHTAGKDVVDVLSGVVSPAYGELRVLGEDMRTEHGRAAVRARIGVAHRRGRVRPGIKIRGLVEQSARRARLPRRERPVLTASILDRLALTPWAEVSLRAAPDPVARRARLAAAAVHQPELLLIDGLLDDLDPGDAATLAGSIRDIGADTGIVAAGHDADWLAMTCPEILTLADGILVGG